jgi:hypothetical protein
VPKILGTSSGKNNKSCRIFHAESNKIWLAFFWFFTILYEFSKFQQLLKHYLRNFSRLGPWKFKIPYRKALGLRIDSQKEFAPRNWVLGDGQRRSGGNSGEDLPESGRGEQESGLGPTRVRFVGLVVGEERPVGGRTGGQRRSPLEPLLRWASGREKATGGGGSPQVV